MSKYNQEDNIDWLAPMKAGQPKKNSYELGVSEEDVLQIVPQVQSQHN
jgi:hypothetical protein